MRLPAGSRLDLNSHYINRTGETTTGEVYANLHFANSSEVVYEAQIFGLSNVDFTLPAGKVTTLTEEYQFRERRHILQLMSHAHEHMLEFRVEIAGGARDGEVDDKVLDGDIDALAGSRVVAASPENAAASLPFKILAKTCLSLRVVCMTSAQPP